MGGFGNWEILFVNRWLGFEVEVCEWIKEEFIFYHKPDKCECEFLFKFKKRDTISFKV